MRGRYGYKGRRPKLTDEELSLFNVKHVGGKVVPAVPASLNQLPGYIHDFVKKTAADAAKKAEKREKRKREKKAIKWERPR